MVDLFKHDFIEDLGTIYKSDLDILGENAVQKINNWVNDVTQGNIPKLFGKGPSTHGEEFVDEVSTKCQRIVDEVSRRIFFRRRSFSCQKTSPRLRQRRFFYLILI